MRTWKWLMRILLLFLLISAIYCYRAITTKSATLPAHYRVPTPPGQSTVVRQYCCSSQACGMHHMYKYDFRWEAQ